MLKGIHPALNAEVLYALRAMGHGDTVVVCDTNFPADSIGRETSFGSVLHMDGCSAAEAVKAILSVMPLDTFIDDAAVRMEVVDSPDEMLPVQLEVQSEIDASQGKPCPMGSVERMAFYEHAKNAYCVISSGERRFYGCFIFSKGVIGPDEVY